MTPTTTLNHAVSRRWALLRLAAGVTAGSLVGVRAAAQASTPTAWTPQTLHAFAPLDGSRALGGQVWGPDGALYGVHAMGGQFFGGTVYRWAPVDGAFSIVHAFQYSATEGFDPESGLLLASDGHLWGSTVIGGSAFQGSLFSVGPTDQFVTRASFTTAASGAGVRPMGGLVEGRAGHLYGTTSSTLYRFATRPGGRLRALYRFVGAEHGWGSRATLVLAPDGWLYGSHPFGGAQGKGTLFRARIDGEALEVVRALNGHRDGANVEAPLLRARDGHFYGTAPSGGLGRRGVVFRLSADGHYRVLHHFQGGVDDGAYPHAGLTEGPDGTLYGCTVEGGGAPQSFGTVFCIPRGGSLQVIHRFTEDGPEGDTPVGALTWGADGHLYGSTQGGGALGRGSLYRLAPPA